VHFLKVFLSAFLISFIITPYIANLGKKQNLVDKPGYRKIHHDAVPNLGGIVIFLGFIFSVLYFIPLERPEKVLIASSIIILILGIVDDITDLKPLNKFLIQMIPGIFFIFYHIDIIKPFILKYFSFLGVISFIIYPIILLWIVGITNSINLIDGLDGLASGISIISLITFIILGNIVNKGFQVYNLINVALLGSLLAFFRYNFYPAQIFLGDSGSTFTGYLISCTSVLLIIYSGKIIYFIIPLIVLFLPIFDTIFAIFRRLMSHKPIFVADQGHLHHRLLKRGNTHRDVVLILLLISVIFSLIAIGIVWLC
jgi:UDP-GlcNAc:undecaprenyl-phosphate GlcNAc-1-phosphate transferase